MNTTKIKNTPVLNPKAQKIKMYINTKNKKQ